MRSKNKAPTLMDLGTGEAWAIGAICESEYWAKKCETTTGVSVIKEKRKVLMRTGL